MSLFDGPRVEEELREVFQQQKKSWESLTYKDWFQMRASKQIPTTGVVPGYDGRYVYEVDLLDEEERYVHVLLEVTDTKNSRRFFLLKLFSDLSDSAVSDWIVEPTADGR